MNLPSSYYNVAFKVMMVSNPSFHNNHYFLHTYRSLTNEIKSEHISHTEMLQPTDTLLEDTTSNDIISTSPSKPCSDTQNDKQSLTGVLSDKLLTIDLQETPLQSARDDSNNTRRTLLNLDHKIDKILCDLARVNWSQRGHKSPQKKGVLTEQQDSHIHAPRHELTTTAARVVFCITRIVYYGVLNASRSSSKHHIDMKSSHSGATRMTKTHQCKVVFTTATIVYTSLT